MTHASALSSHQTAYGDDATEQETRPTANPPYTAQSSRQHTLQSQPTVPCSTAVEGLLTGTAHSPQFDTFEHAQQLQCDARITKEQVHERQLEHFGPIKIS
jgi:hypothetical protein